MYPRDYFLSIPEDHFLNSDTALELNGVYNLYIWQVKESTFYDIEITIMVVSCTETKCPYNCNTKELVEWTWEL